MALNVISNFAANVAHRNLSVNDRMTTSSLAKLSSGQRVVSAKDDAASLAIGSRLNAEVQAQKQAQVNAIQATSMLQIADGAMAKVSDILVRMKTLAVQAGSGQLSSTERSFLDTEFQSLLSEIDRIAADTEFNGVQLVNGSSNTATALNGQTTSNLVQAADGFASIELDSSVGADALLVSFDASTDVLTVSNLTDGTSQGINIGSTAIAANSTQVVKFNDLGVTITLNSAFDKTADIDPTNSIALASGTIANVQLSGADSSTAVQSISGIAGTLAAVTNAASIDVSLGAFSGQFDGSTTGDKTLTLSDGTSDFTLTFTVAAAVTSGGTSQAVSIGDLGALVFGNASTSNTTSFTYKLGTGNTTDVDDVTISVNGVSASALSLTGESVTDVANANSASTAVTNAINTLNSARSGVGAAQNRLEFASDNLAATIENSEAARSNLMDLDVASEMTTFTSKQILVQVGVSMLAQANQLPQNLLRLFQ